MAQEVLVPPLGQTTETVMLVKWYKREGDSVREGEPLFAIETDKATLDIESQTSGVLRNVSAVEGTEVKVLSAIAVVAQPGETVGEGAKEPGSGESKRTRGQADTPTNGAVAPAGAAVVAAGSKGHRVFISPRAKRLAEAEGVAVGALTASGPQGAIVERDVRRYLQQPAGRTPSPAPIIAHPAPSARQLAPEASSTQDSALRTGYSALHCEVDAGRIVELMRRLEARGAAVSLDAVLLFVIGRALRRHPELNGAPAPGSVHAGLVTAGVQAFVVPVVRGVEARGISQLAREADDLITRAQAGTLQPAELDGATFTLLNLGRFDIDTFSLDLQAATATLGAGRIASHEGRASLWLSLSFDASAVNPLLAVQFLQQVTQLIEDPDLLFAIDD